MYVKDRERRFRLVNRQLAEQHGGATFFLGKSNAELFPPQLAAEYDSNDLRVLEGATVQELEHEKRADGEHVFLSEKFPLRDDSGHIFALAGISTDVTE